MMIDGSGEHPGELGAHTRSRSVWPHTVSVVGYEGPGRSSACRYCTKDCSELSACMGRTMPLSADVWEITVYHLD